ncbi:MAG: winged helix-turn-helix domain-containing protein [Defluviitaleaceae bacterium]|nr:winged helix-turn-helix domain-containing protein [Defluviitaleaceae bacterium]
MAKEKVFEALKSAGEMLDAKGIMAATDLERADVDKAIKALRKEGLVDSPKRCFYAVSEVGVNG